MFTWRRTIWTSVITLSGLGIGVSFLLNRYASLSNPKVELEVIERFRGGTLVICGGGSLPKEVRRTFVDLAGGSSAKLVVLPAYEANQEDLKEIEDYWKQIGAWDVKVLQATSREEANNPKFSQAMDNATGVWLSGGSQQILGELYAGTLVEQKIHSIVERGGAIGGTSAGAAAMTKIMILHGRDSVAEGVGFDLLHDAVVDQHFFRRNRIQRLHDFIKEKRVRLGIGVDEGTAFVINVKTGKFIVIGDSYVGIEIPEKGTEKQRFAILRHGDEATLSGFLEGQERIHSRVRANEILEWE